MIGSATEKRLGWMGEKRRLDPKFLDGIIMTLFPFCVLISWLYILPVTTHDSTKLLCCVCGTVAKGFYQASCHHLMINKYNKRILYVKKCLIRESFSLVRESLNKINSEITTYCSINMQFSILLHGHVEARYISHECDFRSLYLFIYF